ncbi:hypothetical protein C8Q78DRAFT_1082008 [Trametes maxima]|nr:hypothetical protein C8Q78DRAFT_1082008 [Trametes maxima]
MSSFDPNSFLPSRTTSSAILDFGALFPQGVENDGSCNLDDMLNELMSMDVCAPTYTYGSSMYMPPLVESSFEPCAPTHLFHSGSPDDTLVTLLETPEAPCSVWSFPEPFPLDDNESHQFPGYGPEATPLAPVAIPEALPPRLDIEPYFLPTISGSAVTTQEEPPSQRAFSPYPCPSFSSTELSSRPSSRASTASRELPSRRRTRPAQKPRNIQVPLKTYLAAMENNDGRICPICHRVQSRARPPDFNRHLLSHCAEAAALDGQHVCRGIPYSLWKRKRIGNAEDLQRSYVDGVLHVGGCGQSFSRPDARKRHVRNDNNKCIGEEMVNEVKCAVRPKATKKPRRRV